MPTIFTPNKKLINNKLRGILNSSTNTVQEKWNAINETLLAATGVKLTINAINLVSNIELTTDNCVKFTHAASSGTITPIILSLAQFNIGIYDSITLKNNNNKITTTMFGYTWATTGSLTLNLPFDNFTYRMDTSKCYLVNDEPISAASYMQQTTLPTESYSTYKSFKTYKDTPSTSNLVLGGYPEYQVGTTGCVNGFVDIKQSLGTWENGYSTVDKIVKNNKNKNFNITEKNPFILLATNINPDGVMDNPKIKQENNKIVITTDSGSITADLTDIYVYYQEILPISGVPQLDKDSGSSTTITKARSTLGASTFYLKQWLYKWDSTMDFNKNDCSIISATDIPTTYTQIEKLDDSTQTIALSSIINKQTLLLTQQTNKFNSIKNTLSQGGSSESSLTCWNRYKTNYVDNYQDTVLVTPFFESYILDLDINWTINIPSLKTNQLIIPEYFENSWNFNSVYQLNSNNRGYFGTNWQYRMMLGAIYFYTSYGHNNDETPDLKLGGITLQIENEDKINRLTLSTDIGRMTSKTYGLDNNSKAELQSFIIKTNNERFYYTLVTEFTSTKQCGYYAIFVRPKDVINYKVTYTKNSN